MDQFYGQTTGLQPEKGCAGSTNYGARVTQGRRFRQRHVLRLEVFEYIEVDYKRELGERFGIEFDRLLTITNMPISRFGAVLLSNGEYPAYMRLLRDNYSAGNLLLDLAWLHAWIPLRAAAGRHTVAVVLAADRDGVQDHRHRLPHPSVPI